MLSLLRHLSWPEWRHHPWRQLAALLAIVLGVALAFSVHLINQSALGEFSAAVRSINGQPDFELRGQRGGFDEALYERVARHPDVALASPVIEVETQAITADAPEGAKRVPLRVLGIDALVAAPMSPALWPELSKAKSGNDKPDRLGLFDPLAVSLNASARLRLGAVDSVRLLTSAGSTMLRVHGSVSAGGPPLAVMDIAGAQVEFGMLGRLSRIDVRLKPGAERDAVIASLNLQDFAAQGVRASSPDEAAERVSNMSRAYRINLTVLALVALFTGAFLVFSILSLSVAQRLPQLALLGVLGLGARDRLRLVLAESAVLGTLGSALGLALGTALAAAALHLLAGDLGGGYFPGVAPSLHFSLPAALAYGALGVVAALIGGWLPAREAQRLAPAQALKGLGDASASADIAWFGPALIVLALALLLAPPIFGMPLAAYVSVALLLLGGIVVVPAGVGLLLRATRPPRQALALLAVERARHQRRTATVAVAGVVASLALSVALTVMVASFRDSITVWLDTVLPADLYVRAASSVGGSDVITLAPSWVDEAAGVTGVLRVETLRVTSVQIDPSLPAVALIARPLAEPARSLPLVGDLVALPTGETAAYVSEAMVMLYGADAGQQLELPLPDGRRTKVFVRGVWRDYARQHGAVVLATVDWQRLTGDTRINDAALWLRPSVDAAAVQRALRELAGRHGMNGELLEFASPGEIRALSLRIFDRSFAVTYWLQGVAIAIGLFGIAASFSAQVMARRKEFGLLAHLGLTRRQVLTVVTAEGAVWTAVGALLGLGLGIAVSVVLVKVVNPQSFHWTMDLLLPWPRLAMLCAAVIAAGTLTAGLAARRAASRSMALSVKEDW
jgi:putative ABC transport system permease protein